jgi:hypothetical protein
MGLRGVSVVAARCCAGTRGVSVCPSVNVREAQRRGHLALSRSANADAVKHLRQGIELTQSQAPSAQRPRKELEFYLALGTAMETAEKKTGTARGADKRAPTAAPQKAETAPIGEGPKRNNPRAKRRSGQGTTELRLLPDGCGGGAWLSGVPLA